MNPISPTCQGGALKRAIRYIIRSLHCQFHVAVTPENPTNKERAWFYLTQEGSFLVDRKQYT
jgi:hypothetical protein